MSHLSPRAGLPWPDGLRPGSTAAVARIQRLGLATALLTGDSERTAQAVAAQLKIPKQNVFARVRPEEKAATGTPGDSGSTRSHPSTSP